MLPPGHPEAGVPQKLHPEGRPAGIPPHGGERCRGGKCGIARARNAFGVDILLTENKYVSKHGQLSLLQARGRMNFQPLLQAPGFGGSIHLVKPLWDLSTAVKMSLQCHRSSEDTKNRSFVSWYSLMYCAMSVLLVCPFQPTLN